MTPAQLRKELGEIVLHVERIEASMAAGDSVMRVAASDLSVALEFLRAVHGLAGRILTKTSLLAPMTAQLTDSDRAQADEAGRRA